MTKPPSRRARDPFAAAEALFKPAPPKLPTPAAPRLPEGKEQVSLRLDRAVLDHFQADGPGWQDRVNAALRSAAGLD